MVMDDKIFLKEEQLEEVGGGTSENGMTYYYVKGYTCPDCGSGNVTLIGEKYDAVYFRCKDCGCTFYGDI
jgi:hypothetical protein